MKKLFFVSFLVFSALSVSGQCVSTPTDPCVSVHQSLLDRAAAAATELAQARDVIAKFTAERLVTEAERNAAKALIQSLNDVLDVRGRIITEYERMQAVYQKVIDMQSQLIEKLTKELAKPKSGWARFWEVLKTVASIAFGIAIGRGL
jgi:hypothetical protein